jgi:lipopolysaccharide export system protein LptA
VMAVAMQGLRSGSLALAAVLLSALAAAAQQGPPNALQGFSTNRNEPIRIESQTLEVRDKEKTATFIDNVKLTQGDTTLESRRLIVFYDDGQEAAAAGPTRRVSNAGGGQQIRRLEATGGVVVTQRDQIAVGDRGTYDMASNSITLIGNVVVTQGKNVIRGDRLAVDLETGVSRMESQSGGQGRVQGVFLPSDAPRPPANGAPSTGAAPGNASTPAPRSRVQNRGSEQQRGAPAPARPPTRIN